LIHTDQFTTSAKKKPAKLPEVGVCILAGRLLLFKRMSQIDGVSKFRLKLQVAAGEAERGNELTNENN
jgi:hypothetical protein